MPRLLHRLVALPVFARVERIREIEIAVGTDPKVVRAVQQFAANLAGQHRDFFIGRDGPELVLLIRAGQKVSRLVEISSVATARRLEPVRKGAIRRIVFYDAVVRLIGEEHIAVTIDSGAFGEKVAFAQNFDFRSIGNEISSSGMGNEAQGEKAGPEKRQGFHGGRVPSGRGGTSFPESTA